MNNQGKRIKEIKFQKRYAIFYTLLLVIIVFVIGYELSLLQAGAVAHQLPFAGVDYDAFRAMELKEGILKQCEEKIQRFHKKHPNMNGNPYMDSVGYLVISMLINDFDGINQETVGEKLFLMGMKKVSEAKFFREIYGYYEAILVDLRYFPVANLSEEADISYVDSWNAYRSYGGRRRHEGTDLMASNNKRGHFPIISMTDGVVEKMGWLEQGGWRIGIRAPSGAYFYYAHLDSFAPSLKTGDKILAGQLLGFMGDSGYGEEGTVGEFDVHLHMGIYVQTTTGEMSVNPYHILKIMEKNRIQYSCYE